MPALECSFLLRPPFTALLLLLCPELCVCVTPAPCFGMCGISMTQRNLISEWPSFFCVWTRPPVVQSAFCFSSSPILVISLASVLNMGSSSDGQPPPTPQITFYWIVLSSACFSFLLLCDTSHLFILCLPTKVHYSALLILDLCSLFVCLPSCPP